VRASEADAVAREYIESKGYGKFFNHSLGHGVGIDVHEKPSLNRRDDTVLKAGMVVTVEPGIYLPDEFGVRLEDTVLVTATGCENLTSVFDRYIYKNIL
jgi:Xaa-Pro aminopeptidase